MNGFNGLGLGMGNLARLSDAETRSISAENPTGEKGKGGMATEGTGARIRRQEAVRQQVSWIRRQRAGLNGRETG